MFGSTGKDDLIGGDDQPANAGAGFSFAHA